MAATWTLGKRIGTGFVAVVALGVLIGGVSVRAFRTLQEACARVATESGELVEAARLESLAEQEIAQSFAYLLTGDETERAREQGVRRDVSALLVRIRSRSTTPQSSALVTEVEKASADLDAMLAAATDARGTGREGARSESSRDIGRRFQVLRERIDALNAYEARTLAEEQAGFASTSVGAQRLVAGMSLLALVLGALVAWLLTRAVTRGIRAAVQDVQSSSAELQASAAQQATASREQAAATNETTTTIKELLATARQIAESAQRVAHIAEQTAAGARSGDDTVRRAQEGLSGIKRQVDLIVDHMLDLGKKSQEIGGILDVINELAEQTNILAINATIEAAGAGEAGRRFGVVADEIRKLADRVGGSTKDIRTLIEEVRAAVNTTVMATEQGTKAVDAGLRQVGEVAAAFARIGEMVSTTTEAAREIELSTRQQTTAVEQVTVAMSDVAQAAKETEAMTGQTSQTAAQLATLSRSLTRMIRTDAAA
jgi:CHASE3 domain sensor protein